MAKFMQVEELIYFRKLVRREESSEKKNFDKNIAVKPISLVDC